MIEVSPNSGVQTDDHLVIVIVIARCPSSNLSVIIGETTSRSRAVTQTHEETLHWQIRVVTPSGSDKSIHCQAKALPMVLRERVTLKMR